MDCLISYIGVKGCGQADAPSGYYINDLLSDSIQQLSKLTTTEKTTFIQIWNDLQLRAVRRFQTDVTSFLSKKYRLKKVLESINLGTNFSTPNTVNDGDYHGLEINLNPSGGCGNSSMEVIHIQYFQIYLLNAETFDTKFYDGETGELLQTITTVGLQGWNKIGVELDFDVTKLQIVYQVVGNYPAFELPSNVCGCNCAQGLGCESIYGSCCDATIKGLTTDLTTPEYGTNTFGMSGIFSVNCSYSGFVCNNKNLFAYALWNLLGYQVMDERTYSSRLNQFTLVNIEGAKERAAKFLAEYNRSMSDTLDSIDLCEGADCCIECNEEITTRISRM